MANQIYVQPGVTNAGVVLYQGQCYQRVGLVYQPANVTQVQDVSGCDDPACVGSGGGGGCKCPNGTSVNNVVVSFMGQTYSACTFVCGNTPSWANTSLYRFSSYCVPLDKFCEGSIIAYSGLLLEGWNTIDHPHCSGPPQSSFYGFAEVIVGYDGTTWYVKAGYVIPVFWPTSPNDSAIYANIIVFNGWAPGGCSPLTINNLVPPTGCQPNGYQYSDAGGGTVLLTPNGC